MVIGFRTGVTKSSLLQLSSQSNLAAMFSSASRSCKHLRVFVWNFWNNFVLKVWSFRALVPFFFFCWNKLGWAVSYGKGNRAIWIWVWISAWLNIECNYTSKKLIKESLILSMVPIIELFAISSSLVGSHVEILDSFRTHFLDSVWRNYEFSKCLKYCRCTQNQP